MPVILKIESLGWGGEAVAHLDGRVVFVGGAMPGDTVEAALFEQEERSARARLLRVLEPSAERVPPGCPHVEACGGCQWLHVSAAAQLAARERLFFDALARIGGISRESLQAGAILSAGAPLRYRTRARLHLRGGRLGYAAQASHALVEPRECRLLDERLEAALLRIRAALEREGGVPRCTDVSLACDERRVTAAFHVSAPSRAASERVGRLVRAAGLDGAVLAPEQGAVQHFGDTLLSLPAPHAPGVRLHGRADLFAQANPPANALLVGEALRLLGEPESVLELYGGAGNFTFAVAARGAAVTSVEISTDALELARRSAREAGRDAVRFINGDSLEVGASLGREGRHFDALLLDPPRTGAKGIGPVARRLGVKRIVYVSCDPATLARDARALGAEGFRPVAATPVDMFPQTFHVEGVMLLERG